MKEPLEQGKTESFIVEKRLCSIYYSEGDVYYFMDTQTYEQIPLNKDQLGDSVDYLKENLEVMVMLHEGVSIGIELPTFVELEVTETEPGFKGDTATGGSKPATLETGLTVQVPLFINIGDVIRVDTRTGEYLGRV